MPKTLNPKYLAGVMHVEAMVDVWVESLAAHTGSRELVTADDSLAREFEARLADCPALAFRVALGVLRNRAEAEDVAQESLIRAYRNFHRLRDREKFRFWLVRTAWRLALDRIRSAGRRERHEQASLLEPATADPTAESAAASREFERHVHAAMDALPKKLRLVMLLAAIEGYDTREVAALLRIPEGTVKSRLFLARKQMADRLAQLGVLVNQE